MREIRHIKKLLEEYYRGNTSTRDEEEIMEFFRSEHIPDELASDAALFGFFREERSFQGNEKLEKRIAEAIVSHGAERSSVFSRWKYYWISGAAAAILILMAVFADLKLRNNSPYAVKEDTYEDPYLAYAEARRVIYFVSEKMNEGTESLKNLEKIDAGYKYSRPVFSFVPGVQKLEYLNTIDETKKLLSK